MIVGTRVRPGGDRQRDRPVRPSIEKGVLFCPDCGHENPLDGDWIREESTNGTSYECPDCGQVVVTQPAFSR